METSRHEEPLDPHLIARLVAARERPDFAQELLAAAQQFDAVQEVFAYRLDPSRLSPSVLLSSSGLNGADRRVALWVSEFHAIDPLMADDGGVFVGHGFTRRVRASEINDPVYREICFEDPRFVDKLSFGWQEGGQTLVLNFYRGRGGQKRLSGRLSTLANIGLSAVVQRFEIAHVSTHQGHDIEWIEARMALRFPQLSSRERQVCARTVAGWSAQTIAQTLGISAGTVLTYRQRAYVRLGYSRAADFLPGLMN